MNHFSQNNEQGKNYCKFNIIAHFKFSNWLAGRLKSQSKHLGIKHTERKSCKEATEALFVHCGKLLESNVELILF